jgi:hypothetical protein
MTRGCDGRPRRADRDGKVSEKSLKLGVAALENCGIIAAFALFERTFHAPVDSVGIGQGLQRRVAGGRRAFGRSSDLPGWMSSDVLFDNRIEWVVIRKNHKTKNSRSSFFMQQIIGA